jgi:hypothetical protein
MTSCTAAGIVTPCGVITELAEGVRGCVFAAPSFASNASRFGPFVKTSDIGWITFLRPLTAASIPGSLLLVSVLAFLAIFCSPAGASSASVMVSVEAGGS